jgi:[ribosomal protein S5]-alanine N-acetyltransferase
MPNVIFIIINKWFYFLIFLVTFKNIYLVRIQARCFVENGGSERVMKKLGMSYEGTLRKAMLAKGEHRDLYVYSILKEEFYSIKTAR